MNKITVIIKVAEKNLIEEGKKSLHIQTTIMCYAVQLKLQKLQGEANPFLSSGVSIVAG